LLQGDVCWFFRSDALPWRLGSRDCGTSGWRDSQGEKWRSSVTVFTRADASRRGEEGSSGLTPSWHTPQCTLRPAALQKRRVSTCHRGVCASFPSREGQPGGRGMLPSGDKPSRRTNVDCDVLGTGRSLRLVLRVDRRKAAGWPGEPGRHCTRRSMDRSGSRVPPLYHKALPARKRVTGWWRVERRWTTGNEGRETKDGLERKLRSNCSPRGRVDAGLVAW
jgi:hypothetical protein